MYQQAAHLHPAIENTTDARFQPLLAVTLRIHELDARRLHGTQGAVAQTKKVQLREVVPVERSTEAFKYIDASEMAPQTTDRSE